MNKALPWNINGVGFDAREAAREAARRQGKSIGEWLHGVIADHASDLGVQERDIVGQDRVDAVTSRLEGMSKRSASFDRRSRDNRSDERYDDRARRSTRRDIDDEGRDAEDTFRRRVAQRDRAAENRRSRSDNPMIEETEFLLEEAIDSMERRASRAQRRTDDALASFAEMLEKNEIRRDREHASITALSQKLSDIESRIAGAQDQSPVKGALARLEARLETIGRRNVAEAAAKQSAMAVIPSLDEQSTEAADPIRRLEDKLNAVLHAVSTGSGSLASSASPLAMAASREMPLRQRRLGDAIAEIAQRQQMLDNPNSRPFDVPHRRSERPNSDMLARDGYGQALSLQHSSFVAMQTDIAALTAKIDDMHRVVASSRHDADANKRSDIRDLRAQISRMTTALGEVVTHGTDARVAQDQVEHERETRRARDHYNREASSLENMVRELGAKIEAVKAPGAESGAVEALQQQISELSARFDRSENELSSLTGLERSVQDLFAHLEQMRASIETSATSAALEALRIAADDGRSDIGTPPIPDSAALKAVQDIDARTRSTLEAVHETLEKVVDRLAVMEGDIAEVSTRPSMPVAERQYQAEPQRPVIAPRPEPKVEPRTVGRPDTDMMLSAPDPMRDPMFGQPQADRIKKRVADEPRGKAADFDEESGRADFIAAARRAAQTAQSDATVLAMKTSDPETTGDVRASVAAKSRDYVASNKRPVLLSLAAIFVVVGTMAIMQRMGFNDRMMDVAGYRAPAKIVRMDQAPRPIQSASNSRLGELTPSELPRSAPVLHNPIPGSDPIQTGSIPSLPAFAAQPVAAAPARQAPSASLQTMAEAGNSAAAFELGARYADGKSVPRDLKLAAKWYEKAANQGLAPAQYRLASLYEKGLGVPQDKARAKILYMRAAEAGNPRAMHNLAVLLADGNGKPDYEGAATWFRQASQYGVHDSQYNLAILLARGLGVQQSLVQSYQWFSIAADQHDPDAAAKRDEVATKLSPNDLAVAKALAAAFHPRSADLAAIEVQPPAGGWDGASVSSPLNSPRAKISSL